MAFERGESSRPVRAGAVIFAKDAALLAEFYRDVLAAEVLHQDPAHVTLQSADAQLVIHAIPAHIASTFTIASPPEPREEAAIKLLLTVASIDAACGVVEARGGAIHGQSWRGEGFTACDIMDPEGNIVQLRALP